MKKRIIFSAAALVAVAAIVIGCLFLFRGRNEDPIEVLIKSGSSEYPAMVQEEYGYKEDRDSDGDLLNDHEEHYTYKTNPFSIDTDADSLYDNRELELSTDPLTADTDKDGVDDGIEVLAGTDPLVPDSDKEIRLDLAAPDNKATLSLSGNANIYKATLTKFEAKGLSNVPGVISSAYWVYGSKSKGELTVQIEQTDKEVSLYKIKDNLEFQKIDTEINSIGSQLELSAKVGSGKYLAGVCSFLDDIKHSEDEIDVFLLVDDSGSMYNEEMDGRGNDPDYKRIDMCQQLLTNAAKGIHFGFATFTGSYMQKTGITEDRELISEALDTIKTTPHEQKKDQFNGTYIATSLNKALDNFSEESSRRQAVVLLTDGQTTESSLSALFQDLPSLRETLDKANERKVSVIVVALGNDVDINYLSQIEESTDGAYIYANDADAMEDLYAAILDAVNMGVTDADGDGENDSLVVADSGFKPNEHGLPIRNSIVCGENYRSLGMCYGFATFTSLYYQKKVSTYMDDMDVTDWNLWFLRVLLSDDAAGRVAPYLVKGVSADDFAAAGFEVSEDGKLQYSAPLSQWSFDVFDRYKEYMEWSFDNGQYFQKADPDSAAFSRICYTEKAKSILAAEDYMLPVWVGNVEYPAFDLTTDETTLTGESLKAHVLLRILARYQISQFDGRITRTEYTMPGNTNEIRLSLASGVPLVLCTSNHAVTVCRLRQDLEDPNLYYLDLYDSNYAGAGTTMEVQFQLNADGEQYALFRYGSETTSDITFYVPKA